MTELKPTVKRIGLTVEPALTESERSDFSVYVRMQLKQYGLSNYEYREDDKEHFFNNGPIISTEDEVYVKITAGATVDVAAGQNLGPEILVKILCSIWSWKDRQLVTNSRVGAYDYQMLFEIPFKGNHYEVLRDAFYNPDTIGRFYDTVMQQLPGTRIRDNDVYILISLPANRVLALRITGQSTRREIDLQDYKERPIKISFGILQERVVALTVPLEDAIAGHITMACNLCDATLKTHVIPRVEEMVRQYKDKVSPRS